MDPLQVLMGVGVLAAWAVLAITIRRWGPGFANRSVNCPTKKVRARVRVEQREGDFASLLTTDIKTCSLFPDAPLTCDKGCLASLQAGSPMHQLPTAMSGRGMHWRQGR